MARLLPYGVLSKPSQGSAELTELVKHFESDVSFEDLQDQINAFLLVLKSPTFVNRPAIREIKFQVFSTSPPTTVYFAQLHFVLVGDGDDSGVL